MTPKICVITGTRAEYGLMRTPPLTCGVLPGVLRAEMAVGEEVLLAEDLPKTRLWLGNALRGLIPARFCQP